MVGLSTPKTMKIEGRVDQQDVIVMTNFKETHNFISIRLVQKLGLPIELIVGDVVLMGTALSVKGEGMCRGVPNILHNIEIVEDFLPMELGSADIILGMQWLESLGGMRVNWRSLTMKFQVRGVFVVVQGDPTLSTSLKAMWKALQDQSEGVLVELGSIGVMECPTNL